MNKLPMHVALKPISWLEGVWRTEKPGVGRFPTIKSFEYQEEIRFTSIGQPMFNYASQSWHPDRKNPMHGDVGYLKIVPNTNKVFLFVAHTFGLTVVEEGTYTENEIRLKSTNVSRQTSGSKPPAVLQFERHLKIVDDSLHQTIYMSTETTPELTQHLLAVYKKQES